MAFIRRTLTRVIWSSVRIAATEFWRTDMGKAFTIGTAGATATYTALKVKRVISNGL